MLPDLSYSDRFGMVLVAGNFLGTPNMLETLGELKTSIHPLRNFTNSSNASCSIFDKRYVPLHFVLRIIFMCSSSFIDLSGGSLSGSLSGNTSEKSLSNGCRNEGAFLMATR